MTAYNDAKKRANKKWDASNIQRVSIAIKAGEKDQVQAAAAAVGESVNQYIKTAIKRRMESGK